MHRTLLALAVLLLPVAARADNLTNLVASVRCEDVADNPHYAPLTKDEQQLAQDVCHATLVKLLQQALKGAPITCHAIAGKDNTCPE